MIGIYLIKCKSENKVYIGQSNNIKKRYNEHIRKLKLKIHPNCYLQDDFDKYGESDFCCELLFELSKKEFSRQKLYELEIQYISKYDSTNRDKGYNIESGGLGKGRFSQETIEKMKISQTGKHQSEETKKLLSEQRKGKPSHWRGKTQSQDHINKRTDCQFGKIWVNNGIESKFVTEEEAKHLIDLGYKYGRPFFKRIKGKKYKYQDNLYTLPQISEMCGISDKTLRERLNKGWSIEKATTTSTNGTYFYNGEYLPLTTICKINNLDYEVIRSRIRRGMSLENAILKPIFKRKNKG